MTIDYAALSTELTTDPQSLGYGSLLASQNWPACAALLNATTGAGTVTLPTMDNESFVTAFLPYLPTALGLAAPKGQFYGVLWQTILAMSTINLTVGSVSGLMAQAVADGVLTSGQATALNQRTGSRGEVLFGVNTSVGWQDVSQAMLGG